MSRSFQVPYTPLSQTLELTKLVQSVDAFSSDVYGLTSVRSFVGAQARALTQRVRILENEVRGWDNKIFLFRDVIPETVLDKFRREINDLTAATKLIHEYFKLKIRTNEEGNASLARSGIWSTPPPSEVPPSPSTPQLDHFLGWSSSSSSSSSSSNSSFSSPPPPIVSPSSHPSPHASAGIGSPLSSGTSSPHIASTRPSDWGLSGVEYVRVTSAGSQYWVRINRNSECDLTSDPQSVSFQLKE